MGFKDKIVQNILAHEIERFAGLGAPSDGGTTMSKYLSDKKVREKFVKLIVLPFARQIIADDQVFVQLLEEIQHETFKKGE